mgnify:CR=1 FL=1
MGFVSGFGIGVQSVVAPDFGDFMEAVVLAEAAE